MLASMVILNIIKPAIKINYCSCISSKYPAGAFKMAQWVKVLAAKSDDLSSIPGPHLVERVDRCLKICPLTSIQVLRHMLACKHTHTHTPSK